MTRAPFAHTAVIDLPALAGVGALSGAISLAVCGAWAHEGPCPLAPHQIVAELVGGEVRLRVLFATDEAEEERVRGLISGALAANTVTSPDGATTTWHLMTQTATDLCPADAFDAMRLVSAP